MPWDRIDGRQLEALALHRTGSTDHDIASELGVTRQAVGLWRKRNGLVRNSRRGRKYAWWHLRARELRDKGMATGAIAEALRKKRGTVATALLRTERAEL